MRSGVKEQWSKGCWERYSGINGVFGLVYVLLSPCSPSNTPSLSLLAPAGLTRAPLPVAKATPRQPSLILSFPLSSLPPHTHTPLTPATTNYIQSQPLPPSSLPTLPLQVMKGRYEAEGVWGGRGGDAERERKKI